MRSKPRRALAPLFLVIAFASVPVVGKAPVPTKPIASPPPPGVAQKFAAELAKVPDLEWEGLARELRLKSAPASRPRFDVRRARYFDLVVKALKLTDAEKALLVRNGVVSVDHQQRYGMGSLYYAIYTRDLPVLITTDSILHAWHRSYDAVLAGLEAQIFSQTIDRVLGEMSDEVARAGKEKGSRTVRQALEDLDLYLTVGRNLLAGAGAPDDDDAKDRPAKNVPVPPRLTDVTAVGELLDRIKSLRMEAPDLGVSSLRGGRRAIDYSQFRPRGHYTQSPPLRRYFRTMMWLGRPDTGFTLQAAADTGLRVDLPRELRAAAAFVLILQKAYQQVTLQEMSRTIDFLVGASDDLSIEDLTAALASAKIVGLADLDDAGKMGALASELGSPSSGRGQVRGQVLVSDPESPKQAATPQVFQVFGQRFALDSFLLAQTVYDSILFHGQKQQRFMPTGLDVMAAFGNDEAMTLLKPEIDRFHYASYLTAGRRVVEAQPRKDWDASAYGMWLDALRSLEDVPAGHFPQAMRGEAWRRKQLQTQLASWTELRHDTVLYVKQSYTVRILCSYPAGYVEPYPELFARLRALASELPAHLRQFGATSYVSFFQNFADRMADLEKLARKELRSEPFTAEEVAFLKSTFKETSGGCGGPSYDGWYMHLFLGGNPDKSSPVVTDVHTNANEGTVLQEGVGDANFLVVAVDNQKDTAVYVGPAYSYYELTGAAEQRLTDEAWQALIASDKPPARPPWTASFQPPAARRTLDAPPPRR